MNNFFDDLGPDWEDYMEKMTKNKGSSSKYVGNPKVGCGCGLIGFLILSILGVVAFVIEMIHVYF